MDKQAARIAKTKADGKTEAGRRNEFLKNFQEKDKVTNGTYIGYVSKIDTVRGELVVRVRTGKDVRMSPEFTNKIP